MTETFLSAESLATRWDVPCETVWRWSKSLPNFPPSVVLTPEQIRWRLSDIQEWEKERVEVKKTCQTAFDIMADKFPDGFTVKRSEGSRVLTVTDIQRELNLRGMQNRAVIRSYVETNGGWWGKYKDENGRRVGNACIAV